MEGDTPPASVFRPLAAGETWDKEGATIEDKPDLRIRHVDPLLVGASKDPFAALIGGLYMG
ncbi:hypothetical protein M404DRAFT_993781 [Pisolithus tinctorius Marx 270]|uniref:Uncharacterized protein n=1 Tax=Pisolithus tinctorius Marx 270 TaxID=870435 RepID=A0A0C3JUJ3_PISTI|nr:hypothetical protein M404DRAFT_993781 [Pisolithus tinctorius Marx 270]